MLSLFSLYPTIIRFLSSFPCHNMVPAFAFDFGIPPPSYHRPIMYFANRTLRTSVEDRSRRAHLVCAAKTSSDSSEASPQKKRPHLKE